MIEIVKCVMLVFLIVALIAFMIMAGVSLLVLGEVVTKDEARRWLKRKKKKTIEQDVIAYIDNAFDRPGQCNSVWIDEQKNVIHGLDVCSAFEWWRDIMKPELLRVFGEQEGD